MHTIEIDIKIHGFRDLFFSKGWRISYADYDPSANEASSIHKMEKHLETDEVFFLVSGIVYLVTGGKGERIECLNVHKLEKDKLFIIEKGEWHVAVYQQGAATLIVENEAESLSVSSELNQKTLQNLIEIIF